MEKKYVVSLDQGTTSSRAVLFDRNAGVVSHVNVNDKSCEGMYYSDRLFTVQFHPEACAGPLDSKYLFDEFIGKVAKYKKEA